MDHPGVEDRHVAGLDVSAQDLVVLPVALDVGKRLELVFKLVVDDLIAFVDGEHPEVGLGVAHVPGVGALHELKGAALRDRHERHPRRAGVEPLDRPARRVLVERRAELAPVLRVKMASKKEFTASTFVT
jgi:hypothetical protein|tara:strand:- start:146 stop:535 length:390 start_codon:yes stop_codon:yes gene_type:complete